MKLFTKVMAAALLSTALSTASLAMNFADLADAAKPAETKAKLKMATNGTNALASDVTFEAGFVDAIAALDTSRFSNKQSKRLVDALKGIYADLTVVAGDASKLKAKLATPVVGTLVFDTSKDNADYKNAVNGAALKLLADAVIDDPFIAMRAPLSITGAISSVVPIRLSIPCADDTLDLHSLKVGCSQFIEKIISISDHEVEKFLSEKTIVDSPRFKRHLRALIEGYLIENTEVSNHILEKIDLFQQKQKGGEMKRRLRQLSFLNVEGDPKWFDPFYTNYKGDVTSNLTFQMQMMIDCIAFSLFAPSKLLLLRAAQKMENTPKYLKDTHFLYTADG